MRGHAGSVAQMQSGSSFGCTGPGPAGSLGRSVASLVAVGCVRPCSDADGEVAGAPAAADDGLCELFAPISARDAGAELLLCMRQPRPHQGPEREPKKGANNLFVTKCHKEPVRLCLSLKDSKPGPA